MNRGEFHKRLKEILSANQDPRNSPNAQIHDAFDLQVRQQSGEEWDESVASQLISGFEWATRTQPKRYDITEADIKIMISEFMAVRGYKVTNINEGSDKTPDCFIEKGDRKYLSEIKSPLLNIDIDSQLYKFKTSHRKLLDHIHTAIEQFTDEDPKHNMPWVLVYTSSHPQLNWKTFTDALQGGVIDAGGQRLPDFTSTAVYKSSTPLIRRIDGYIWLQANGKAKTFLQVAYILNASSAHKDGIEKLIMDLSAIKPSNGMDLAFKIDTGSGDIVLGTL